MKNPNKKQWIVDLMKAKGYKTQEAFAKDVLKVEPRTFQNYLSGLTKTLNLETMIRMADALNTSVDYLIGRPGVNDPEPNFEVIKMSEKTGLSCEAINALMYMNTHSENTSSNDIHLTNHLSLRFLNRELEQIEKHIEDYEVKNKDPEDEPILDHLFFNLEQYINGPDEPYGIIKIPGFKDMNLYYTNKEISRFVLQKRIISYLDSLYDEVHDKKGRNKNGKY